jgi:hypothetical protein
LGPEIEEESVKNGCFRVASQSANRADGEARHRARSLSVRLVHKEIDDLLRGHDRLALNEHLIDRFQLEAWYRLMDRLGDYVRDRPGFAKEQGDANRQQPSVV